MTKTILCINALHPDTVAEQLNIRLSMDGTAWCATTHDFVNLAESPAGLGDNPAEAIRELIAALSV